ncbi:hypothetical protein GCM10010302_10560 [Streptomyces polychromogenes]|uniref:Integral membrane protein n=2 Tax=Streptomyces TaxID=1883 RepID=A0ABN0V4C4_9ACTN
MSPRLVTRLSVTTAIVTPCALVGLAALASNPDYGLLCGITGFVVLVAGLGVVTGLRPTWWLIGPALALEIVLLVASRPAVRAEVMVLRGVRTPVVVTAAHRSKDKAGRVSWKCDLRRTDGLPLPHSALEGYEGCFGPSDVGRTQDVLVDPAGWVPPQAPHVDRVALDEAIVMIGAAAVLFAGLAITAGRLNLRAVGRRVR